MNGTVSYTPIGGNNMDYGIATLGFTGSTVPGIVEGGAGTTVNLMWEYPGGISGKAPNGVGWGYAVTKGVQCTTEDLNKWLMGQTNTNRKNYDGTSLDPNPPFTQTDIDSENPQMAATINALMYQYVRDVLDITDPTSNYNTLATTYAGCVVRG